MKFASYPMSSLKGDLSGGLVAGVIALPLASYYLFPKITRKIPSVLVALLVGTGVAVMANLTVPTIGDIPSGIPSLQIGEQLSVAPEHYTLIIGFGLTLALLGSIDSLLTSVIADNITKTKHDSRRELIGQGICNAVAALFGGLPGAGATKGTVVASAKYILVIGHSHCGAVRSAIDGVELGNITSMLSNIRPAVQSLSNQPEPRASANEEFVNLVTEKNVRLSIENIRRGSSILREMEVGRDIGIAGAVYDMTTGEVRFLDETARS